MALHLQRGSNEPPVWHAFLDVVGAATTLKVLWW
jgi:hypothetical protein